MGVLFGLTVLALLFALFLLLFVVYFCLMFKIDDFVWCSLFNFIAWRVDSKSVEARTYAQNKELFLKFYQQLKPGVTYTTSTHKAMLLKLEAAEDVQVKRCLMYVDNPHKYQVLKRLQNRYLTRSINLDKIMSDLCLSEDKDTLARLVSRNKELYPEERLPDGGVRSYFITIRLLRKE